MTNPNKYYSTIQKLTLSNLKRAKKNLFFLYLFFVENYKLKQMYVKLYTIDEYLKWNEWSYSQFANMQFRTPADTPRSNQGSIISLEQKRAVVIF